MAASKVLLALVLAAFSASAIGKTAAAGVGNRRLLQLSPQARADLNQAFARAGAEAARNRDATAGANLLAAYQRAVNAGGQGRKLQQLTDQARADLDAAFSAAGNEAANNQDATAGANLQAAYQRALDAGGQGRKLQQLTDQARADLDAAFSAAGNEAANNQDATAGANLQAAYQTALDAGGQGRKLQQLTDQARADLDAAFTAAGNEAANNQDATAGANLQAAYQRALDAGGQRRKLQQLTDQARADLDAAFTAAGNEAANNQDATAGANLQAAYQRALDAGGQGR